MPANISKTGLAKDLNFGEAYSDRNIALINPNGTAITKATTEMSIVPTNNGTAPKDEEEPT